MARDVHVRLHVGRGLLMWFGSITYRLAPEPGELFESPWMERIKRGDTGRFPLRKAWSRGALIRKLDRAAEDLGSVASREVIDGS